MQQYSNNDIRYTSPNKPLKIQIVDINDKSASIDDVISTCINKSIGNSPIAFLDYHGVLDTINPEKQLLLPTICISYIGSRRSRYYTSAISDIINRIKSGQILFGLIVFTKQGIGSKGWIINEILTKFNTIKSSSIFIDDCIINYNSVKSYCPYITSHLFQNNDDLLKILEDFANRYQHLLINSDNYTQSKSISHIFSNSDMFDSINMSPSDDE